jgi:hypothetical protein
MRTWAAIAARCLSFVHSIPRCGAVGVGGVRRRTGGAQHLSARTTPERERFNLATVRTTGYSLSGNSDLDSVADRGMTRNTIHNGACAAPVARKRARWVLVGR